MSDAIITVEGLGKRYSLSHLRDQRYVALRDVLVEKATRFFRKRKTETKKSENGSQLSVFSSQVSDAPLAREDFWALKNVSFEVKQGEVLGIIGRNGAGKSTLLKILSRITEPTEGRVKLKGRVASLLEVGTGFHPELTGRENIYLNGAILGMSRAEIRSKFDEIVAFAETEKFLDTPVKRYSSGMYVRLAFAVAAHLEPEILIVDEVLAVGDAEFQKKCLGKMRDVAQGHGRTVLFVSHNMAAVRNICSSGILLSGGVAAPKAQVETTIQHYLATARGGANSLPRASSKQLQLLDLQMHAIGPEAGMVGNLLFNEPCAITFTVEGNPGEKIAPVLRIYHENGQLVSSICAPEEGLDFRKVNGACTYRIELGAVQLMPGSYFLDLCFFGIGPEPILRLQEPFVFEVHAAVLPNASRSYRPDHGIVRLAESMQVTSS